MQRVGYPGHRIGCGICIKSCDMRKKDGMDSGMREIEAPTQNMRELMVKRHPDGPKHHPGKARTILRLTAMVYIVRVPHKGSQTVREAPDTLCRHQGRDGIRLFGIEPFHTMRDGVHPARAGETLRHVHGERRIV